MYSPSANSYTFGFLAPGQTSLKATTLINPKMLATGQTPILLTVQGTEVYVLTSSALAANGSQTAQIADYAFDAKGMLPKGSPKLLTVLVSGHIVALAAFPGHLLFLLLDSGAVESLQLGSSTSPSPIPVQVRPPLPFPLAVSASAFTPTTPVPTVSAPVAATGTSQLGVDGSGSLAASVVGGIAQLSIADPASHRVLTLILTPTGGGVAGGSEITLQVVQQYVSLEQLAHPQSVTENAKGVVSVLEPASASVVSLVSINTSVQTSGKCT